MAVMIIPSIAACLLSTPYMEVTFVTLFGDPYISAGETFKIMFGDSWRFVWPVVLISIFQVVGASLIMSAIDRHFRTGTLSLKSPMRLLNYSIFPIALGVIVMCLVSILLRFVLFGLVMLVQFTFSAMHAQASAALAAISVISIGMFAVHVLIITSMLYWAPSMFIYGYKFRDAVASSIKLISGKKLFVGLMLPMTFCAMIQLLVGFLHVHIAIACVVGFIVYLFTNVYSTVYVILSFYMISGLERRDVLPYRMPLPQIPAQKPTEQKSPEPDASKAREKARPDDSPTPLEEAHAPTDENAEQSAKRKAPAPKKTDKRAKQKQTDATKKTSAQKPRAKTDKSDKPAQPKCVKNDRQSNDAPPERQSTESPESVVQDGEGGGDVV